MRSNIYIDVEGKTFGYLTAVERTDKRSKHNTCIWLCKCKCGEYVERDTGYLNSVKTPSCGCYVYEHNKKNITGQTFGLLTAVEQSDFRLRGYVCWDCVCECGGTKTVPYNQLVQGITRSCGCLRKRRKV